MAVLELDITSALRAFAVELKLDIGEEVVALVGPSGAGKTTVLRAIAGLHRPDQGRIASRDETWFQRGPGRRTVDLAPEARSVGYVPQHHALFPHLTVRRNVAFSGADDATVASLLRRLGIEALAGERPAQLSGGERQRVALARALARQPNVLLLDEPLAALDAHTRRVVRAELGDELSELGIPTLIVTHDFVDAAILAERIAVIVDGTLRQLGTAADLIAEPVDRFVVALAGGSVVRGVAPGGDLELAVYPWEVEVRPGAGPPGALTGVVAGTSVEAGRLRVRVADWVGEAETTTGLEIGEPAHGLVRHRRLLGHGPAHTIT
jgi:molybdate transport system ATP-binding protein